MNLNELREERGRIINAAREIIERAEKEKRELTSEENANIDKAFADADALKEKIERMEKLAEAERDLNRKVETMPRPEPTGAAQVSRRATPEYHAAFLRYLKAEATPEDLRALQADVGASGGYAAPSEQFVAQLFKAVDNQVFVRRFATKIQVNGLAAGVPVLDAGPADPAWTSELLYSEDSTMAFGKRTLTPNLLTKMIKVSRKLLRVSGIDVDALVRDQLSYKIAVAQEKAYLTGGGSGEPLGLFTASANGVTTARDVATGSTTSITADGLIAAKYALKDGYLADPSCVWLLSRTALAIIRKLKDATSGQYLWVPGLQQDRPDTVLGIPVACSEYVPTTFSSNAYVGVIGALRYYLIADSLNVEIQVVDQTYAATNQIGYIVRYEGDGIPAIAEAFARMKCAS